MSTGFPSPTARRAAARAAVEALDERRDEHVRLRVRCAENHHVATVYDTTIGLVYTSRIGGHAHGSKDFVDVAHHDARHGVLVADLVDPGPEEIAEDELPASCECGPRTVSRADVMRALAAGERRILVP